MTGINSETVKDLYAPFPADMISWRAQMVVKSRAGNGFGALALAYLNSRDVMDRLDSVCGPENWQCKHYDANGKMACSIGININGEWIWKSDGAGDTDIEAEKGAFSGALKRAAVQWGIGRYLYDLGNTWVPCEASDNSGKPKFKKFLEDPWKHVKNANAFLPKQQKAS
jgi:hypothetical protein